MNQINGTTSAQSLSEYARTIDEINADPEVRKTQDNVDFYQKECERLDTVIAMPRDERAAAVPGLHDKAWSEAAATQAHGVFPFVLCGTLSLGALSIFVAGSAGLISHPVQSLLTLGLLAGCFSKHGLVNVYSKALKKWVLPAKTDKKVVSTLKEQSKEAHSELEASKVKLDTIKTGKLKKVVKEMQAEDKASAPPSIEDETEYLTIDGVKLKKQKSAEGDVPFTNA